ncbi:hypothetical protein KY326_03855 [Candidatus Woesearchaeota archaeon]|nr:hypothetical protein [Candidatus Woesearchaeota archaeon]
MVTIEGHKVNDPVKHCPECGKEFNVTDWFEKNKSPAKKKNMKYTLALWHTKKFCNKKCSEDFYKKQYKHCLHCGNKFFRVPDRYSNQRWGRVQTCSRECMWEKTYITKIAGAMGLTYDILKPELLKIAEKYANKK